MFDPSRVCMRCMNPLNDGSEFCALCGSNSTDVKNKAHQLECGSILAGTYLVGLALGQGGFGITYLGYDLNLNIKVAIKEYYPEGCVTRDIGTKTLVVTLAQEKAEWFESGKTKFMNEAKMLANFSGDSGIVNVRNFFHENGTAYIVMDYVEGETLKQYAERRGGRIPADELLRQFKPLFASIMRIHEVNLLHRDISPDNIMLRPDGTLTLLDFGAARQMSTMGEHSNTINVKHGFAPEEQYRTRGEQGPWTDVYALCATIYKLATGITPPNALDRAMQEARLVPPNQLGAAFTPQQEEALMHGLMIRATERTKNAHQLFEELYTEKATTEKQSIQETAQGGKPFRRNSQTNAPSANRRPFYFYALIGSGVVIVALLAVLAGMLSKQYGNSDQSGKNDAAANAILAVDDPAKGDSAISPMPDVAAQEPTGTTANDASAESATTLDPTATPDASLQEKAVSLTDRVLTDEEIAALCEKSSTVMQKAISLPADAIALLNACVDSGAFRDIVDGSQTSAPGSNVFTCASGESCLGGALPVDPKDFSMMMAYLLSDDYETGVITGFPFGGPNAAIFYIHTSEGYQLINAGKMVHHGRPVVSREFEDATVSSLEEYIQKIGNKKVYRSIYSIPGGKRFSYTDKGDIVEVTATDADLLWSLGS